MSLRFAPYVLALGIVLAPAMALADDAPTPTTTDTPSASASYTLPAGLGPAQSSNAAGGSNADAGALQPAGRAPLQSGGTDSAGLTAPNQDALQAPVVPDDTLKVVLGDADGPTHQFADDNSGPDWSWLWWTIGLGLVALAGGYLAWRWLSGLPVVPKLLSPAPTSLLSPAPTSKSGSAEPESGASESQADPGPSKSDDQH